MVKDVLIWQNQFSFICNITLIVSVHWIWFTLYNIVFLLQLIYVLTAYYYFLLQINICVFFVLIFFFLTDIMTSVWTCCWLVHVRAVVCVCVASWRRPCHLPGFRFFFKLPISPFTWQGRENKTRSQFFSFVLIFCVCILADHSWLN